MPTQTYIPLANLTLSGSASVTFSSISQAYRDLVLVVNKPSGDYRTSLNFNGDTGATYLEISMQGNGTTASSAYDGALNYVWGNLYQSGGTAQSLTIFNIMDYSATDKHKTVLVRSSLPTLDVAGETARWASTSAITTILVSPAMPAGTTLALYGIAS